MSVIRCPRVGTALPPRRSGSSYRRERLRLRGLQSSQLAAGTWKAGGLMQAPRGWAPPLAGPIDWRTSCPSQDWWTSPAVCGPLLRRRATVPGACRRTRVCATRPLGCPADPPTVEEIILVMRQAGSGRYADRTRGLIATLPLGDIVGPLVEPLDVLLEGAVAELDRAGGRYRGGPRLPRPLTSIGSLRRVARLRAGAYAPAPDRLRRDDRVGSEAVVGPR